MLSAGKLFNVGFLVLFLGMATLMITASQRTEAAVFCLLVKIFPDGTGNVERLASVGLFST